MKRLKYLLLFIPMLLLSGCNGCNDGVLGTAHTGTTLISGLNRSVTFNIGISTDIITNVNIPYYFNN